MRHVKFDGSGFIGFRNLHFIVDFFLYELDIFNQIIISIILHVVGVGVIFYL